MLIEQVFEHETGTLRVMSDVPEDSLPKVKHILWGEFEDWQGQIYGPINTTQVLMCLQHPLDCIAICALDTEKLDAKLDRMMGPPDA